MASVLAPMTFCWRPSDFSACCPTATPRRSQSITGFMVGRAGIEQLAVLDVEQRARDQLGNRGEIGVDVARVAPCCTTAPFRSSSLRPAWLFSGRY
ncbi:MAG: hypothetical protein IPF57_03835 [Gammaproteobacteria bacterium]|nr:hypothetical protein [Gammaproteobacteria bacterium]